MKKMLLLLIPALFVFAAVGTIAMASTTYTNHGDKFNWKNVIVFNNQWGRDAAANSDKYQHIVNNDNGSVSFQYKWAGSSSTVKGYPTLIAGWHYGNPGGWMTSQGSFGLPAKVSDNKAFATSVTGTHYNAGTYAETMNLSWDVWLADSSNPSYPSGEIMVWPWRVNQQPIGSKQETVSYWGASWDVYRGSMTSGGHTWNVVSFLRTSSTLSTGGNLRDFINECKNKGWISSNQYIVGIELGNEIMQGHGSFNYTNYTLAP